MAASQSGPGRHLSLLRATHLPWESPGGFQYLAGGLFHGYLSKTYGPESVTRFYLDQGSRFFQWLSPIFPAVGFDAAARKTFGKGIPGLWRDWQKSVAAQGPPRVEGEERLTHRGWTMDGLQIADDKAYYLSSVPVKTAPRSGFSFYRVVERDLDTGREKTLVSQTAPFVGSLRVQGKKLYYTTQEYRRGYPNTTDFGYVSRLWEVDLGDGSQRVLLEAPFRAILVLSVGTLVYSVDRQDEFGSYLVRIVPKAGPQTFATTTLLVDEFMGDGKRYVATARLDGGSFGLYDFDPKTGGLKKFLDSPWLERAEGFYGDRLLFTSNIDKTYGIYSYDFRTKRTQRLTQGGYAVCGAIDLRTDRLFGIGLNEGGVDLYRFPNEPHPIRFPSASEPTVPSTALEGVTLTEGGYGDNLRRMVPRILHTPFLYWMPGEHLYGVALSGGDAVYDFPAYLVALGRDEIRRQPIGSVVLTSAFFSPLVLGGQYLALDGDQTLSVAALYPLALRLSPGLASLWAGVSAYVHDDLRRNELSPYVSSSFHWAGMEGSLQAQVPMERRSWGSRLDRDAFFGSASWRQYLPASQIQVSGTWIEDLRDPDNPFATCRGYRDALEARRGFQATVDYSLPFLKVRRGLWNPSLYAEDLVLDLFSDGAWATDGRSQVSYGAQLTVEGSVTTAALPLDVGVRYARTREGRDEVALTLELNLPFAFGGKQGTKVPSAPMDGLFRGLAPNRNRLRAW